MTATLPTTPFTEAKRDLSRLMNGVVRDHQPAVIKRGSHERMLLLDEDSARLVLRGFWFDVRVVSEPGAVTAEVRDLGIVGSGTSFDEAIDDAVELLRGYAADFFARANFYAHTDRARHAPWLLRFAVTPEDEQRALFLEPPPTT